MRSDLKQVEDKVSRIGEYAKKLHDLDRDWSHLRNQEDYPKVWKLPDAQRQPIDALYAQGRQDAINLKNWFWELDDPSRHPTLSSFVDVTLPALERTIVDLEARLTGARRAHQELDQTYWSVSQMIELSERQAKIVEASIKTLESMKNTNLYREERGEALVSDKNHITINTNSYNSHSIIQSPNATLTVSAQNGVLFSDLRKAIQVAELGEDHKAKLSESVDLMETTHGSGDFIGAYQRFMGVAADHLSVFAPFMPALVQLLSQASL